MRPLHALFVVVLLLAPAARAEMSKGHRILLERGLQIQAQAFYHRADVGVDDYVFDPRPYLTANFTSINWHDKPLDPAFHAAHPAFPWARWFTKTGDTDLAAHELPYKDHLIALQYKDENSLNNPDVRADFKAWFAAARAKFPNTILFTNQLAFDATDANLAEYLRDCKPDMLCMDSYRWKLGNTEGTGHLLSDMQRYRKWALGGHDGSGKRPIPYALYPQTFHGENLWRDPSESELRFNHFAAWALGYTYTTIFTYNYGSTALFAGTDTSKPTPTYHQLKEINRQGKNLGPALVRLISKEVLFVPGTPGQAPPIDMPAYPAGFNQIKNKDPHVRGVAGVTNLGKTNSGKPGDVVLNWFQVLDESLDGEAASGEWYFMVTNALVAPDASAADTRQRIEINFASTACDRLERLSRDTGKVEEVALQPIPNTDNRRKLILELDGGTADLFKFKTGAPFVGVGPAAPRAVAPAGSGTDVKSAPRRPHENRRRRLPRHQSRRRLPLLRKLHRPTGAGVGEGTGRIR
jgi:hypothetical protein